MLGKLIEIFIPPYYVTLRKHNKCKECGGKFTRESTADKAGYPIVMYCICGNRIVINWDGQIMED